MDVKTDSKVTIRGRYAILIILLGIIFLVPQLVQANDCGTITAPQFWFQYGGTDQLETVAIENCQDPFVVTTDTANPYVLLVGGEVVDGDDIFIETEALDRYSYQNTSNSYLSTEWLVFRHEGEDFVYIDPDVDWPEMTTADYEAFADLYFSDPTVLDFYLTAFRAEDEDIYLYDSNGNDLLDESGNSKADIYNDFVYAAEDWYYERNYPLTPGTYTFVWRDVSIIMTRHSLWEKFKSMFLSTAYASMYSYVPPRVFTKTVTIVKETPVPTGASSVLFLPGIQGSRLYMDGWLGTENQLWEPNINSDVKKLAMDEQGHSHNDVYTRDIVDEIYGIADVYKTFVDLLRKMKDVESIEDYKIFAYDWRYDVRDIVTDGINYETETKFIIDEIVRLASSSFSGKVTIISHSNGGLLAKSTIEELKDQNLESLVDKVVFIGTPHLGTPKAVGSMLHGYNQQFLGGLIIDDKTARDVMRNMPGAYALLPSEKYFEVNNTVPVISHDDISSNDLLASYGDIYDHEGLYNFMIDSNGTRINTDSIYKPNVSNSLLFTKAIELHRQFDEWSAPPSIQVFEIAGTGLATVNGFEYRNFSCSSLMSGSLPCAGGDYSKPFPRFTTLGDDTVIENSATAYNGDKTTIKVDLSKEGAGVLRKEYGHSDLTESQTIQGYIDSIIKLGYQNSSLDLSNDSTDVIEHSYNVIGVHSPVQLLLTDNKGHKIGKKSDEFFDDIYGAQYFELADSKFVVVPEGVYSIELLGYATGTYAVTVDQVTNSNQIELGTLLEAPVVPGAVGIMQISDNKISHLNVDMEGDGISDYQGDLIHNVIINTVSTSTVVNYHKDGPSVTRFDSSEKDVAFSEADIQTEYLRLLEQIIWLLKEYLFLIKQ